MSGGGIHIQKIALDTRVVDGFGSTPGNNQILFVDKSPLDRPFNVSATVSFFIRLIDASFHKIIPTEYLFGPDLEGIEKRKVPAIRKSKLVFTISDKTFNRLIIVVNTRIINQFVNPIHLK